MASNGPSGGGGGGGGAPPGAGGKALDELWEQLQHCMVEREQGIRSQQAGLQSQRDEVAAAHVRVSEGRAAVEAERRALEKEARRLAARKEELDKREAELERWEAAVSGQASELVGQRECLLEVQQAVLQHYFDMQARVSEARGVFALLQSAIKPQLHGPPPGGRQAEQQQQQQHPPGDGAPFRGGRPCFPPGVGTAPWGAAQQSSAGTGAASAPQGLPSSFPHPCSLAGGSQEGNGLPLFGRISGHLQQQQQHPWPPPGGFERPGSAPGGDAAVTSGPASTAAPPLLPRGMLHLYPPHVFVDCQQDGHGGNPSAAVGAAKEAGGAAAAGQPAGGRPACTREEGASPAAGTASNMASPATSQPHARQAQGPAAHAAEAQCNGGMPPPESRRLAGAGTQLRGERSPSPALPAASDPRPNGMRQQRQQQQPATSVATAPLASGQAAISSPPAGGARSSAKLAAAALPLTFPQHGTRLAAAACVNSVHAPGPAEFAASLLQQPTSPGPALAQHTQQQQHVCRADSTTAQASVGAAVAGDSGEVAHPRAHAHHAAAATAAARSEQGPAAAEPQPARTAEPAAGVPPPAGAVAGPAAVGGGGTSAGVAVLAGAASRGGGWQEAYSPPVQLLGSANAVIFKGAAAVVGSGGGSHPGSVGRRDFPRNTGPPVDGGEHEQQQRPAPASCPTSSTAVLRRSGSDASHSRTEGGQPPPCGGSDTAKDGAGARAATGDSPYAAVGSGAAAGTGDDRGQLRRQRPARAQVAQAAAPPEPVTTSQYAQAVSVLSGPTSMSQGGYAAAKPKCAEIASQVTAPDSVVIEQPEAGDGEEQEVATGGGRRRVATAADSRPQHGGGRGGKLLPSGGGGSGSGACAGAVAAGVGAAAGSSPAHHHEAGNLGGRREDPRRGSGRRPAPKGSGSQHTAHANATELPGGHPEAGRAHRDGEPGQPESRDAQALSMVQASSQDQEVSQKSAEGQEAHGPAAPAAAGAGAAAAASGGTAAGAAVGADGEVQGGSRPAAAAHGPHQQAPVPPQQQQQAQRESPQQATVQAPRSRDHVHSTESGTHCGPQRRREGGAAGSAGASLPRSAVESRPLGELPPVAAAVKADSTGAEGAPDADGPAAAAAPAAAMRSQPPDADRGAVHPPVGVLGYLPPGFPQPPPGVPPGVPHPGGQQGGVPLFPPPGLNQRSTPPPQGGYPPLPFGHHQYAPAPPGIRHTMQFAGGGLMRGGMVPSPPHGLHAPFGGYPPPRGGGMLDHQGMLFGALHHGMPPRVAGQRLMPPGDEAQSSASVSNAKRSHGGSQQQQPAPGQQDGSHSGGLHSGRKRRAASSAGDALGSPPGLTANDSAKRARGRGGAAAAAAAPGQQQGGRSRKGASAGGRGASRGGAPASSRPPSKRREKAAAAATAADGQQGTKPLRPKRKAAAAGSMLRGGGKRRPSGTRAAADDDSDLEADDGALDDVVRAIREGEEAEQQLAAQAEAGARGAGAVHIGGATGAAGHPPGSQLAAAAAGNTANLPAGMPNLPADVEAALLSDAPELLDALQQRAGAAAEHQQPAGAAAAVAGGGAADQPALQLLDAAAAVDGEAFLPPRTPHVAPTPSP